MVRCKKAPRRSCVLELIALADFPMGSIEAFITASRASQQVADVEMDPGNEASDQAWEEVVERATQEH